MWRILNGAATDAAGSNWVGGEAPVCRLAFDRAISSADAVAARRASRRACPIAHCPLGAQSAFCTVQPFWELIEYLYQHAHELSDLSLYLFKAGELPDSAKLARGSRLHLSLSALCADDRRTVADAASALLMHIACATSEHEQHVHGLELSFSSDATVTCSIWVAASLAANEEALADLREEISEALDLGGAESADILHGMPFDAHAAKTVSPLVTRAIEQHPNPLLEKLMVRRATTAKRLPWSLHRVSHYAGPCLLLAGGSTACLDEPRVFGKHHASGAHRHARPATPSAHGHRPAWSQGGAAAQPAKGEQPAPAWLPAEYDSDSGPWRSHPWLDGELRAAVVRFADASALGEPGRHCRGRPHRGAVRARSLNTVGSRHAAARHRAAVERTY